MSGDHPIIGGVPQISSLYTQDGTSPTWIHRKRATVPTWSTVWADRHHSERWMAWSTLSKNQSQDIATPWWCKTVCPPSHHPVCTRSNGPRRWKVSRGRPRPDEIETRWRGPLCHKKAPSEERTGL